MSIVTMNGDSSCPRVCVHTRADPLTLELYAKEIMFHIISSVIFD